MQLNLLNWLLAFSPVAVILFLMLGLRWGGSKAGAASWFATLVVAALFFGAGPELIAYTQVKAILLAVDVLLIIWAALLLFHIADEAGAVKVIGQALPALTADRTMQGLLVGWLFASFLQGMGGFGVPVAVAAPLLVGAGFTPVQAVLMSCLGHGWAVSFGSLATAFQTLMAVTNLPGTLLAPDTAFLLGISSFTCGVLVAAIAGGFKGMLRTLPAVAILSVVMGSTQYFLATNRLWTLGSTGAGMAGLAAGLLITRIPFYRGANGGNQPHAPATATGERPRSLWLALTAYLILVSMTFALYLIPPVTQLLSSVQFTLPFPELRTSLGWATPAELGRKITIFSHPGAVLIYASSISFLIYSRVGYYRPGASRRILDKLLRGSINSSLGILSMVGVAVVMSHTGMTYLLAKGISESFNRELYPLAAPLIGALGAFITGSNNNSNVLFAILQQRTAELMNLPVPLILGEQSAGGALGSIMAPNKVIVGCSTVGLSDQEGLVMRPVILYGLIPVIVVGLVGLFLVG